MPVSALAWFNYQTYGDVFTTGYALTGEQQAGSGFSWASFHDSWRPYLEALMSTGAGVMFSLGVVGMFAMLFVGKTRAMALLLLFIVAPITITYMAYYWGNGGTGLRFMIPTFALYFLPGMWLIARLAAYRKPAAVGATVGLLALQGLLWGHGTWKGAVDNRDKLERMHDAVAFLDESLPADSVLIADRRVAETLQYYDKWTLLDERVVSGQVRPMGRPGGFGRRAGRRPLGGPQDGGPPDGGPPDGPDAGAGEDRGGASPMQRDKAKVFRKELIDASRSERRKLIAGHLEALRARRKGGIYWLASTGVGTGGSAARRRFSRFLGGSGTSARSAMRRLKFADGSRFKFVDSVQLAESTETRRRKEYEELHGEPPPEPRRRRGGMFGGRRRGGAGGLAGMFGPRAGQRYRLYKLAGPGEKVRREPVEGAAKEDVDETEESPTPEVEDPPSKKSSEPAPSRKAGKDGR